MKKHIKKLNRKSVLILTVLLLCGSISMSAQIGFPNDDGQINDAPIDGFIITGLIAGAAIGIGRYIRGMKE